MFVNFYIPPRNLNLATDQLDLLRILSTKCCFLSLFFLVGSCLNCSTTHGKSSKDFVFVSWDGKVEVANSKVRDPRPSLFRNISVQDCFNFNLIQLFSSNVVLKERKQTGAK